MDAASLTAVVVGTVLVVALGVHIWYAIGLSRVFAAHGAQTWRAWVPLVNEAEVFRLGRIDPVRAVLLIVPFVNIYALVLKATAAHRLGMATGRGSGTTALAVVLPPVWAGVLAGSSAARESPDAAVPTAHRGEPVAATGVVADAVEGEQTAAEPIAAVPGVEAAAPAAPAVPAAAAGTRRAPRAVEAPAIAMVLAGPVDIAPRGAVAPAAPDSAAPDSSESDGATEAPARAVGAPAHTSVAPIEPADLVPAVGPAMVDAIPASAPSLPADASRTAPAGAREMPIGATGSEADDIDRVAETTDSTASAPARETVAPFTSPVEESTQTARPRSRRRGEWILGLPDGQRVSIIGRTVVLGRKPAETDESVQYVAVADHTRTVSKQHARLDWTVTGWTITDLTSTNGVTLLHDDGRTQRLHPETPALVPAAFQLGDARIELNPGASA